MKKLFQRFKQSMGYTLMEMLMVISLVGILTGLSVELYDSTMDDARFDATYKEMLQLRKALLGDLDNTNIEGERTRFGYLGDVGSLPTASQGLAALVSMPAGVTLWSIDSTSKLGTGWNGPYITSTDNFDFSQDAWGRNYVYVPGAAVPHILSYGADGQLGGEGVNQDIQVDLPITTRIANVYGQITTSGAVYDGKANVVLYYPNNGSVMSQSIDLAASSEGSFAFASVPFGPRTIKVTVPDTTTPMLTLGPVTFPVDNPNYIVPTNLLEINPLMSDSNCNTIANLEYEAGSMQIDETNKKVTFQVNVDKSFTTRSIYTTNSIVSGGATSRLEQLNVGGVTYGCVGLIDLILFGGGSRKFNECAQGCRLSILGFCVNYGDLGYVTLNTSPNLTTGSNWGIPAKEGLDVFLKFQNSIAGLSWIDLQIGCDQIRVE